MTAAAQDDYLGGLQGLGAGLGFGLVSANEQRQRLFTQRATVCRLIDDVARGRLMVPSDAGRFWHSDAQRACAARLQQLRGRLALGQLSLEDARGSIDRALHRLALAEASTQEGGRG